MSEMNMPYEVMEKTPYSVIEQDLRFIDQIDALQQAKQQSDQNNGKV